MKRIELRGTAYIRPVGRGCVVEQENGCRTDLAEWLEESIGIDPTASGVYLHKFHIVAEWEREGEP